MVELDAMDLVALSLAHEGFIEMLTAVFGSSRTDPRSRGVIQAQRPLTTQAFDTVFGGSRKPH